MTRHLAIRPLTPERWPDLERWFGPNGACARWWCIWRRRPRSEIRTAGSEGNRRALQAIPETAAKPDSMF